MVDGKLPALIIPDGFGRAAEKLADTIQHVVNLVSGPDRVRAQAQARADAAIISARAETEIADIQERARHRLMNRELRRQVHIEQITVKAIAALPTSDQVSDKPVDEDWVTRFFEHCQDISDDQMQELWAKILAGEVAQPGTFSPRTLSVLRDLDSDDATLFNTVCGTVWHCDDNLPVPIVFNIDDPQYQPKGINFSAMTHLATLGLITFNKQATFVLEPPRSETPLSYFGESRLLRTGTAQRFPVGAALFTSAGLELHRVSIATGHAEWRDLVLSSWMMRGWRDENLTDEAPTQRSPE